MSSSIQVSHSWLDCQVTCDVFADSVATEAELTAHRAALASGAYRTLFLGVGLACILFLVPFIWDGMYWAYVVAIIQFGFFFDRSDTFQRCQMSLSTVDSPCYPQLLALADTNPHIREYFSRVSALGREPLVIEVRALESSIQVVAERRAKEQLLGPHVPSINGNSA
jgi:hypothetical protein